MFTESTFVSLISWGNTSDLYNHMLLLFWSLEDQLMPCAPVQPSFVLHIWEPQF